MTCVDLGYELFKDKDTLKSKFFIGNMLDESFLADQQGKYDIIHMGSFLHLFPYDTQGISSLLFFPSPSCILLHSIISSSVQLVKKIGKLLVPKKGSMIAGRQVGNANPGHYDSAKYDPPSLSPLLCFIQPHRYIQPLASFSLFKTDLLISDFLFYFASLCPSFSFSLFFHYFFTSSYYLFFAARVKCSNTTKKHSERCGARMQEASGT